MFTLRQSCMSARITHEAMLHVKVAATRRCRATRMMALPAGGGGSGGRNGVLGPPRFTSEDDSDDSGRKKFPAVFFGYQRFVELFGPSAVGAVAWGFYHGACAVAQSVSTGADTMAHSIRAVVQGDNYEAPPLGECINRAVSVADNGVKVGDAVAKIGDHITMNKQESRLVFSLIVLAFGGGVIAKGSQDKSSSTIDRIACGVIGSGVVILASALRCKDG
ncbi:hypothetical protein COCOBI_03-2110 [Coccomyxa sp. Obi]|nr:hypothetical protein COCOBI_03-2110 [Coccomyxa sp. Obi]